MKPEDAYSDLHVLAAIEVICENSIFRTIGGRKAAKRIARICRAEAPRQLRAYEHGESA